MDTSIHSSTLAHVFELSFKYGGLWIHIEELEQVRAIMVSQGQDTSSLDLTLAQAQQNMAQHHADLQALFTAYHLMLGHCQPGCTMCAIDDGLP